MLEQKSRTTRDDAAERLREDLLLEAEADEKRRVVRERLLAWEVAESRDYHEQVQRRKKRVAAGFAPPREHDQRVVYPWFDEHNEAMLERWNTHVDAVFRQLAVAGRNHVIEFDRFPDTKMLKRWFAELKPPGIR